MPNRYRTCATLNRDEMEETLHSVHQTKSMQWHAVQIRCAVRLQTKNMLQSTYLSWINVSSGATLTQTQMCQKHPLCFILFLLLFLVIFLIYVLHPEGFILLRSRVTLLTLIYKDQYCIMSQYKIAKVSKWPTHNMPSQPARHTHAFINCGGCVRSLTVLLVLTSGSNQ